MEFLDKVSEKEFQEIKKLDNTIPKPFPNWKYYWVKVSENDFLHKIHIIPQGTPQDPIGWGRFSPHLCLGHYSKQVLDSGYYIGDELIQEYPELQTKYFNEIKEIAKNFSKQKMLCSPLCYWANKKTGPYVIRESIRRHIAAYIHYFILEEEKLEPISNAICMIPDDEQFNTPIIPNDFCNACIK